MKRHSLPLLLIVALLLCGISFAFSATQLATNTLGELVISDANNKTIKSLSQGSVGEVIQDSDNTFKISYGKDLQGNFTAIIYAVPSSTQSVELSYQGKNISISKEAVLTLIFDSNGAILQSGILGQVVVDNEAMKPSSNLRISNSGTVMTSQTPITPIPSVPAQLPVANTDTSASMQNPADLQTGGPVTDNNVQADHHGYGYASGPNLYANSYSGAIFGTAVGLSDSFGNTNGYGYQNGNQVGYPTHLASKINPQLEDAINRAQTPYAPRLNPSAITPVHP